MCGVLCVTVDGTRKSLRWCVVCLVTLEYRHTKPPTLHPSIKGIIWMRNVGCSGTETSIGDCGNAGWGYVPNCWHSNDVGVTCKPGK